MSKYLIWSITENQFIQVGLPKNSFVEGYVLHKAKYLTPTTQAPEESAMTPLPIEKINEFYSTGLLQLPVGDFEISDQLLFDRVSGIRIEGAGMSYQKVDLPYDKQVTRLFWTGDANVPMIDVKARHGVFRDIQLVDGRVKIRPDSGWGTGLCYFDRVSFFGSNAGITFGDVAYNGNAADSKVRDCQFINCDKCIELTTSQNVNYVVDGGLFYRCDTIFDISGGGLVNIRDSYLTQVPIVFTITGNGSNVGSQNANFAVRDIKYDASQDVKPLLVRDTGSSSGTRKLSVINAHQPPLGLDTVLSDSAPWAVQNLDTFT